jgi:uncharacterized protein YjbI with pentapeptide repeats
MTRRLKRVLSHLANLLAANLQTANLQTANLPPRHDLTFAAKRADIDSAGSVQTQLCRA